MSGNSSIEIWSEILHYVLAEKDLRILLTFSSGDKYDIKDRAHVSVGRYVLTVFDETGAKLLFQMNQIVCVDVFELED